MAVFPGDSVLPPVFFSSLALLKITVNPSAEAGSLTSHSPNLGSGGPFSCRIIRLAYVTEKLKTKFSIMPMKLVMINSGTGSNENGKET